MNSHPPPLPKATGKPPKKGPTGSKIYVSSKVVDALVNVKKHTEELGNKRSMLKERLQSLPKERVIDENKMLAHIHKAMENNGYAEDEEEYQ